jgi:hypothetical protein
VHGVARIKITEERVLTVGGTTPDFVAGIKVTEDDRKPFRLEIGSDLVAKKRANIAELEIT